VRKNSSVTNKVFIYKVLHSVHFTENRLKKKTKMKLLNALSVSILLNISKLFTIIFKLRKSHGLSN
jgi:hypothetical protein